MDDIYTKNEVLSDEKQTLFPFHYIFLKTIH